MLEKRGGKAGCEKKKNWEPTSYPQEQALINDEEKYILSGKKVVEENEFGWVRKPNFWPENATKRAT